MARERLVCLKKSSACEFLKGKSRIRKTAVSELKLYQEIVNRVQGAAVLVSLIGGSLNQPGPPFLSSQGSSIRLETSLLVRVSTGIKPTILQISQVQTLGRA